jgi:hypothetical protein
MSRGRFTERWSKPHRFRGELIGGAVLMRFICSELLVEKALLKRDDDG